MMAKKKRNTTRNFVYSKMKHGNKQETFDSMTLEMVQFYTSLIGTTDPHVNSCSLNDLQALMPYILSSDAWTESQCCKNRSEFFASGMSEEQIEKVCRATGFIPVRYLEIPLVTRKSQKMIAFLY
ncbi:hypothetical protein V6N12_012278 [Hibiscus sabdariffa]|uniref:Uncharacterized protein n=1 Tax=Hibiscus sabdariffa TaxID=183260 RepID=A0ABR2CI14_9ROSI